MNKLKIAASLSVVAILLFSKPLIAEPIGYWWTGGGMGVIEHGYNRGDGTEILISCSPDQGSDLSLSMAIKGRSAENEYVVFSAGRDEIEFYADKYQGIELVSRSSVNNVYFLFDLIKRETLLRVRFSPISIHSGTTPLNGRAASQRATTRSTQISLAGSARDLGASDICGG